jgi:hypothetical protein
VFRCGVDQVVKTSAAAVEGPISSIVCIPVAIAFAASAAPGGRYRKPRLWLLMRCWIDEAKAGFKRRYAEVKGRRRWGSARSANLKKYPGIPASLRPSGMAAEKGYAAAGAVDT